MDDLKKAITMTDPEINHAPMEAYLCWAFNVQNREELEDAEPIETKPLISRLKHGNLRRIGKKP